MLHQLKNIIKHILEFILEFVITDCLCYLASSIYKSLIWITLSAGSTVHFSREIFRRKFYTFRDAFYLKEKCKQRCCNSPYCLFIFYIVGSFNIISTFRLVSLFDFASERNIFYSLAKRNISREKI